MNIPILGDATHKVCESFGVLNPEDGLALRYAVVLFTVPELICPFFLFS